MLFASLATNRNLNSSGLEKMMIKSDADIIVVGAGPVGMLAALLSAKQGSSVLLLEQSADRPIQSRAIGITPPSLEILSSLDLAEVFIAHGVTVGMSDVYSRSMRLGRINFTGLYSDFSFVLSIPQDKTEAILEGAVLANSSVRFLRGHRVTNCSDENDHVIVGGTYADTGIFSYTGQYLLACDGGKSTVRENLGISFVGAADRYTYLMGDYEDTTGWGNKACFFFTARGSVESFPLPDERRRYIVRTPRFIKEYTTGYLRTEILNRAGINVDGIRKFWESGFGVKSFVASSFCKGRFFLCGDSAHLISPIGGQNMNTGFADAELAVWLTKILLEKRAPHRLVVRLYDRVRKQAVGAAQRRAQCLMLVGTSGGHVWSVIRNAASLLFLHSPLRRFLIQLFSMQSIPYRNLKNFQKRYEKELEL
jgi:2-polyprenyl-6-methoxyphenol hydroxylase-like FAD-dependent oxidoreductase